MSTHLHSYLFFAGKCEEAIEFYKQALGATVGMLMRFSEAPDSPPPGTLQPGFENKVMHASLHINGAMLMMSDGCDDSTKFGGFAVSLSLPSQDDARKAYDGLLNGGQSIMPLGSTFWSPCFGMVIDRFGVQWMVTTND